MSRVEGPGDINFINITNITASQSPCFYTKTH